MLASEQVEGLLRVLGVSGPRILQHLNHEHRAIDWIKKNFQKTLSTDTLASVARMSASSLHQHFKTVTGMSPLQYQKNVRLHEARRLMLSEALDAAVAGHSVGYESPSQFSREYRRLFGAPPVRDIATLRKLTGGTAGGIAKEVTV